MVDRLEAMLDFVPPSLFQKLIDRHPVLVAQQVKAESRHNAQQLFKPEWNGKQE
jgi:hypothetical protein